MLASKNKQSVTHKVYSLLMLLALAWLTISLPFVYADQQAQKEAAQKQHASPITTDDSNTSSNTTEEKTANGTNLLSEYLHEMHHGEHTSELIIKSYPCHPTDLYLAFHPEAICPPPDTHVS
jgi:hypothetical protein